MTIHINVNLMHASIFTGRGIEQLLQKRKYFIQYRLSGKVYVSINEEELNEIGIR